MIAETMRVQHRVRPRTRRIKGFGSRIAIVTMVFKLAFGVQNTREGALEGQSRLTRFVARLLSRPSLRRVNDTVQTAPSHLDLVSNRRQLFSVMGPNVYRTIASTIVIES
ncbi:MAG: hypothetical protein JO076_12765 [Verrucomicrobia bacterium]|nr:hypothetical protein [Verrucomicrobiota bacterium]